MNGLGADPLDSALVRLRAGARILGAGFLVAPDVIATCAHVIDGETPVADFPMLRSHDHAVDVLERDDELDVAILRLADPPRGALPVPARITGGVRDHRFRTFGFPHDLPDGIWVTGRLVGAQGAGRIQMAQDPDHWRIEPGFSGAPVWDEELAGVVGMVATVTARSGTTAHLVPTTALGEAWTTPGRNPYRGLQPFDEEHADLFHGRDGDIDRLVQLLRRQDIVAVAGPSGSGKSSLVRAGLIPRLKQAGATVVDLGPDDGIPESPAPGTVLVLDQFEETVVADPAAAREKLATVTRLAADQRQQPGTPAALRVVLTLRSRTLDELITKDTVDELNRAVWFLEPMSREQLASAIEGPTAVVGGLAFESGLVQRILDDTTDEPGTLPLVSLVLDQLWQRRHGGWLMHNAYENLGRVPGALSKAADDVLESLTPRQRSLARQLVTRLTRPDGEGGYARRSARLADLDPEIRDIAQDLAGKRLLVIQDQTVNLTHQALIDHWPELHGWLVDDADFLSWQAKLHDLQESGGLLRDAPLAEAADWLRDRAPDIPEHQQQFIRRSEAAQRQTRNRWRTIAAVVGVLALVAGGLAVWATTANEEVRRQLRIAQSKALAEESKRFHTIDPRAALQLAQAAWRTAPTAEAYGTLLTHYAGLQQVERVYQNVWPGNLGNQGQIMTSPDGSVAAFVSDGGRHSTWAGLNGDSPHQGLEGPAPSHLTGGYFQLSPSGKLLGYANPAGIVGLSDLEHHTAVTVLRDTVETTRSVQSMAFSPDETRLLIKRSSVDNTTPELELWDLVHRRTVPIAESLRAPGIAGNGRPFLGPTPNTMVISLDRGPANVYDLTTGRLVRSVPTPGSDSGHVALGGAVAVHCVTRDTAVGRWGTLQVTDLATGAPQRSIPVPPCDNFTLDTNTNYALITTRISGETDSNRRLTITDLRTGATYLLNTTPSKSVLDQDEIAVFTGADGNPVALVGNENLLYRQRPVALDQSTIRPYDALVLNPRGDLRLRFTPSNTMTLTDRRTRATVATADGSRICGGCSQQLPVYSSPHGDRLLTVQDNTLVIYSVPTLAIEARIALPLPPGLGGPPTEEGSRYSQWGSSLGMLENDQVTVLHAGMITRWNLTDRTQIGSPTQVRPDGHGLRRAAHAAVLEPRPHHPAETVVVEPNGTVEVWNLDEHRVIAVLGEARTGGLGLGVVRFDPQGSVAAVDTRDDKIQLWDVDQARKRGRPIPAGTMATPRGFTPDGKVVTGSVSKAQIWDQDSGKLLASFTGPDLPSAWIMENYRLTMFGRDEDHSLEWNPKLWMDTLCRLSNRDFTDDERAVLAQLGAPDDRPCG
jgi:WD40 repeat protein